jgi:hypothetical protein
MVFSSKHALDPKWELPYNSCPVKQYNNFNFGRINYVRESRTDQRTFMDAYGKADTAIH